MVNEHLTIGLYEKALPSTLSWFEKLMLVKQLQFDFMEMSIDESDEKLQRLTYNKDEIDVIRKAIMASNMEIGSICLSALRCYALGSETLNLRNKGIEICKKAIDLANELGVRMIQIPGYDVFYETSNTTTEQWFLKSLKFITKYASSKGVLIGFETMETAFMDTVSKAMRYVNEVDSPYLQLYPDVGNLSNAMQLYNTSFKEDLQLGKGHILALHLKETRQGYYRNLNFGEGTCNFAAILNAAFRLHVHRFVCEIWYQGEVDWFSIVQKNKDTMFDSLKQAWKIYESEVM